MAALGVEHIWACQNIPKTLKSRVYGYLLLSHAKIYPWDKTFISKCRLGTISGRQVDCNREKHLAFGGPRLESGCICHSGNVSLSALALCQGLSLPLFIFSY